MSLYSDLALGFLSNCVLVVLILKIRPTNFFFICYSVNVVKFENGKKINNLYPLEYFKHIIIM